MANSITLAQNYLPLLDEIYKRGALTSPLDTPNVRFINAQTIQVFKTSMDGLGNYNRNTGFVDGSVTGSWEALTLSKDRGRSFSIDAMDNEETVDMAFGTLVGEFMRTKVNPEIDAYRFAKMAGTAGISKATAASFSDTAHDVAGAIDEAEKTMNDNEVPVEGRLLFISENAYKYLKQDVTRELGNDTTVNRVVETFDRMPIIRVPSSRFNTGITLQDGTTTGQTGGGYTTSGQAINFLIVHPSAVVSVVKHAVPRIFNPGENQTADAWKFDYRIYHDLFVYANKVNGIYLHAEAAAG